MHANQLFYAPFFTPSTISTLPPKMLRARFLVRLGRQTRFLHSANVLRKNSGYEDVLMGEFEHPPSQKKDSFHDPFAALKQTVKDEGDEPLAFDKINFNNDGLDEADFSFDSFDSGFGKTNRFKYDAMEDQTDSFDAPGQGDSNNTKFDWAAGPDQWGTPDSFSEQPKDRYFMPQDMDISPLRGNSDQMSTHVIPQPEYGGDVGGSATFEKIFARVMGGATGTATVASGVDHKRSRELGSEYDSSGTLDLDAFRRASGVELPSINSPYMNLFDSNVPELFVEICAEPDMDVRHEQIEALDLAECNEVETGMIEQLQKLIRQDSDYEVLEFMNKQLEVFEELDKDKKLPSELPPLAAGFPLLLNESLQLLVEKFESPAEAIALFDAVKKRTGSFFFATVSTDVYFSMIKIVWEFYRDLSTLMVLASDVAMMNIKSKALIKTMEDVERECYKGLEARKRRVPEYEESITARVQTENLRQFSVIINHLRRGLQLKDNRQRAFRLRGEVCTY